MGPFLVWETKIGDQNKSSVKVFFEKQPGPIGPHQLAEALWSTQYEAALVSPDGMHRLS